MRESPDIPEEQLRACLQQQYALSDVTLEFLPRGQDYNAGVYRVMSEQGTAYLLKVTSRPLYEASCLVPRCLWEQQITSVVAPIPTRSSALWTKLSDWTVIVYPWISGDSSLTGMTNEQWKKVGRIFRRIHQVRPQPGEFLSLREETFDSSGYAQWVSTFETQHLHNLPGGSDSIHVLHTAWMEHQSTIDAALNVLEKLSAALQSQTFPYVICHADLHARNLIRDPDGQVFVIDWDEVKLAPKERDYIFIREPNADAFWEGYGKKEIDWILLSYYLWERVVQDLIEDTQNVCFKEDLAEETKKEIAQAFHMSLGQGGKNIAAACQASARIAM